MPPIVATVVYLTGVAWLFRRDFRQHANVTAALWLPFFWVVISGSRFVSEWLAIFGLNFGGGAVEEGSPIDAIIFFILIGVGLQVLYKRRVSLQTFVQHNRWVTLYLCYCLLAIVWSDFPFVAFKRWIKLFGQPVMVLILLTEPDPLEALARLMKRVAYVIAPVSILFIKYYPDLGRGFDPWSGTPHNTGITTDKNALGYDCLVLGFFFFWYLLKTLQWEKNKSRRQELIFCAVFLFLIGWLMRMAQSSTSLVSLLIAITTVLFLGFRFVNKKYIGAYLVVGAVIFIFGESVFGIFSYLIQSLGKDPTLTGRTEVWQALLKMNVNPILGTGFESFWLGDRREQLARMFWWQPNEAHNGYLETYLNLGLVGLFVTGGMLLATYFKARRELFNNFDFGRFRLGYLAAFIIYNCTEAAFRTHIVTFFLFFVIAIDYPRAESNPAKPFSKTADFDAADDLASATAKQ